MTQVTLSSPSEEASDTITCYKRVRIEYGDENPFTDLAGVKGIKPLSQFGPGDDEMKRSSLVCLRVQSYGSFCTDLEGIIGMKFLT